MTFNSLQYAVFLPVVLVIYWLLGRRAQNVLILAASYLFYGAFDWRFVGLLMLSTITDYTVGRLLEVATDDKRRKRIFAISLCVNLGILGFFKYFDFFTSQGTQFLHHLGINLAPPVIHILLPLGISFYTFHGISYTFDVYRRKIEPTHSLLSFAVFVAFFPQLVAGPIGRAHLQLPQFERQRTRPNREQIRRALFMILMGLFKKVAIADALAPYVNKAFSSPSSFSSLGLLVGAWGFCLQVYGDFAGYSDIAIGSAALLGIDLPVNFRQPYLSRSITEIWRRWHISLSNWLRDYLYIPLGGSRGSELATYRNLMLTMVLCGLWHGAATTFIVFGAVHGTYMIIERRYTNVATEDYTRPWRWKTDWLRTFVTFQLWALAVVLFRAPNFTVAGHYLVGIFSLQGGVTDRNAVLALLLAFVALLFIDLVQDQSRDPAAIVQWKPTARGALYGAMLLPIIIFSGGTPVPFVYFRF